MKKLRYIFSFHNVVGSGVREHKLCLDSHFGRWLTGLATVYGVETKGCVVEQTVCLPYKHVAENQLKLNFGDFFQF